MHPMDTADRKEDLKYEGGIGYCNINKCCTEVCPEHIRITDNAIIPLKERVADDFYDPIRMLWRRIRGDRYGGNGRSNGHTHSEHIEVSDEARALDEAGDGNGSGSDGAGAKVGPASAKDESAGPQA
jgi:hypothetical protein